jgi:hypothetical protein
VGATSLCREYDACTLAQLCDPCRREMVEVHRAECHGVGVLWARRVFRQREFRARDWPTRAPKTLAIARRHVTRHLGDPEVRRWEPGHLTDPRLVEELAAICSEGAAEWWANRWTHRQQ